MDLTIFLRAFSIFSIVSGHLGFIGLAGGAFYLIFLSGFNFVKFNFPKVEKANDNSEEFNTSIFISIYFGFLLKIIVPVLLYTLFIYVFLDRYYLGGILLISNFYGPNYADGLTFWFIEVLVQIYILFGLLMLTNKYYYWIKKSPYISFLIGFAFFYAISILCKSTWDTSFYLDRFPHLMMYMFFAGALVAFSQTQQQKIMTSCALAFVATDFILFDFSSKTMFFIIGAIATLWIQKVSIPKLLHWPISIIAMSSLFIYLSHFQAKSLLDKLLPNSPAIVVVCFALIVGIIMSEAWKKRKILYTKPFNLKGFFK